MTIYVVTTGEYSGYGVMAVFSTEDKAREWIKGKGWRVWEEWEREDDWEEVYCYIEDYEVDPEVDDDSDG